MILVPPVAEAKAGDIIRAKWMLDDSTTLAEAAERARIAAAELQALHDAGWTLAEPIRDDYGFLVDPDGNTGEDDEYDEDGEYLLP